LFTALVPIISPLVQPHLLEQISSHPWGYIFPAIAITGLFGMRVFNSSSTGRYAFVCSCSYIAGIVGSTAFGIYPYVLPSNIDPSFGLTIEKAAAPLNSLEIGLAWFVPALLLAIVYLFICYRSFGGKVSVDGEGY
jgi:cytochrome d ubiquinol oxidase subunit II